MGSSGSSEKVAIHCVSVLEKLLRQHLLFERTYAKLVVNYGDVPSTHNTFKSIVDTQQSMCILHQHVSQDLVGKDLPSVFLQILDEQIQFIFIHDVDLTLLKSRGAVEYHARLDMDYDLIHEAMQEFMHYLTDGKTGSSDDYGLYAIINSVNALVFSMMVLARKRAHAEMTRDTTPSELGSLEYFEAVCQSNRKDFHDVILQCWDDLDETEHLYLVKFAEKIANVKSDLWKDYMKKLTIKRPSIAQTHSDDTAPRRDDRDEPETPKGRESDNTYFIHTNVRGRRDAARRQGAIESGRRSRAVFRNRHLSD